jgi:hypothetical protein
MIFLDDNGDRNIRIYIRNLENSQHQFVQVNILSHNHEPMKYPLLMPYGDRGWGEKWLLESYDDVINNRYVTMHQYIAILFRENANKKSIQSF